MPGSELVQSVQRSLDIVEAVAQSDSGLTLRQLAEDLGLKPPTVHSLAKTLVARRYLEKTPGRPRYRLGPAALRLADAFWERRLIHRGALAVRELSRELPGATVLLAEAVGGEILTTLRVRPERPGILERPRARTLHPYATSCALVYQAFWSEEERNAFRERHPFQIHGAHIWGDLERLDAALEEIRKKGYADPGLVGTGGRAVAAPVFAPGGDLAAALGASAPPNQPPGKPWTEFCKEVIQTAETLSRDG